MSSLKIYLYAFISMSFWALSFIWYKEAFISYGPVTIILFRLILSVAFLTVLLFIIRKSPQLKMYDYKYLILLSFFEPFCYFMGEGFGMQYVSPTTGAIIISTIPLITPFFLALMGKKEKISLVNYAGMFLSFSGIIIVVGSDQGAFSASIKGVFLLFVAVISAIFFSIILKEVGSKYDSIVIVFWQNLIAVFMFAPVFFMLEFSSFIHSDHKIEAVQAIVKLGIFPSTISFLLFIPVVTYLGATKANTFANLIPVITALFSFFFYGEQFGILKGAGVAVVISGLFILQIRFRFINKNYKGAVQ